MTLTLKDNGLGFPDVTGDDGIYSAYFTVFDEYPGFYSNQGCWQTTMMVWQGTPKSVYSAPNFTSTLDFKLSEEGTLLNQETNGKIFCTMYYQTNPVAQGDILIHGN